MRLCCCRFRCDFLPIFFRNALTRGVELRLPLCSSNPSNLRSFLRIRRLSKHRHRRRKMSSAVAFNDMIGWHNGSDGYSATAKERASSVFQLHPTGLKTALFLQHNSVSSLLFKSSPSAIISERSAPHPRTFQCADSNSLSFSTDQCPESGCRSFCFRKSFW